MKREQNPNTVAWKEYVAWREAQGQPIGNKATALALLDMEVEKPGYLTVNEREFVTQMLGREALDKVAR